MQKVTVIGILVFAVAIHSGAQPSRRSNPIPVRDSLIKQDSVILNSVREMATENLPIISVDASEINDKNFQNISTPVTSTTDVFLSQASFNFNPVRFRLRGYDTDNSITNMNGITIENLENGFAFTSLLSGFNDVLRNREVAIGLQNNSFSFGGIAVSSQIDSRPQKFRKQSTVSYAFADRGYVHKISFTHTSGIDKKGWSFVYSGSRRWADEGYVPGTYLNAWSGLIGVDKKIGLKQDLSFVAFGTIAENGRQGFAVAEMDSLAGSHYYNPFWGYQNGKKRNANIVKINQPYLILTHEYRIRNSSSFITALAYSFGDHGSTFLDWYNAPDPRPDYYRYLPSYQTDPYQKFLVQQTMMHNENDRQINWQRLYDVNRGSMETIQDANGITGNSVTGKRSHYVLAENIAHTTKFDINSTFNTVAGKHLQLSSGVSYQFQKSRYYKKLDDLLGGDFFVDLNQFAERTFPSSSTANQNDLDRPNRILSQGDQYGWDYNIISSKAKAWLQTAFTFKRIDLFFAAEGSDTKFIREGNVKNGLFPGNSMGPSPAFHFIGYGTKAGITYKINGRNYVYINAAIISKSPSSQNVFVSAKTRNEAQSNLVNENIRTAEAGYILHAPKVKLRLTGYFTRFDHQLDVINYYDDDLLNYVNYALSNISKLHYGTELGIDAKLIGGLSLKAAASIARYYYDSRPTAVVTVDNTASVVAKDILYLKNYFLGGMPQQAYSLGFQYQTANQFYLNISGNLFKDRWMDINPVRHTYRAVQNTVYQTAQWNDILQQTALQDQFTVDVSGGYTLRISKKRNRHKTFLNLNGSINNLFNNQNIESGASEQWRFDFSTLNTGKFPPKFYYYNGLNFMFSSTIRF